MTFEINVLVLLFVAELVLVLMTLSTYLSLRMMKMNPRRRDKGDKDAAEIRDAKEVPEEVLGNWLVRELEKQREALYALSNEDELEDSKIYWKRILEQRNELLEAEHHAWQHVEDRSAWKNILKETYGPLLKHGNAEEGDATKAQEVAMDAVTRSEEEIARLRAIIDEQQGVVGGLRKELSEISDQSEQWDRVVKGVDHVKVQGEALSRSANVLDYHNSRILEGDDEIEDKGHGVGEVEIAGGQPPRPARPADDTDDAEDLYGLKTLIGDQQETISKLRGMLEDLVPEAERSKDLANMLDSIQQANSELIGCVAILETENDRLTAELEQLKYGVRQDDEGGEDGLAAESEEADPAPDGSVDVEEKLSA